ncbi:pkd2 [Symbiodinium microadriaticum]|nr:pkd2 [Symbiodinium microadriaticum]
MSGEPAQLRLTGQSTSGEVPAEAHEATSNDEAAGGDIWDGKQPSPPPSSKDRVRELVTFERDRLNRPCQSAVSATNWLVATVVFEDSGLVPGCPLPPLLESDSWTVDLPSVCLGLCIGLLIGPLLDLGFLTGCTFCVRRCLTMHGIGKQIEGSALAETEDAEPEKAKGSGMVNEDDGDLVQAGSQQESGAAAYAKLTAFLATLTERPEAPGRGDAFGTRTALASFAKHRAPEPGEEHRTKIMDSRWVSACGPAGVRKWLSGLRASAGGPVLFDPYLLHSTESWEGSKYVLVAFCVRGFEKLARKQRATAETFGCVLPKPVTKQGDAECYRLGGAGLDFPQGSGMIRTRSKKPSAKSSELELADLYSRLQADFCGLAPRGARQRSSRGSGDWVFNLCVACTKFVTKFFVDAAPYEDAGLFPDRRKLDIARSSQPQAPVCLSEIELVEPKTAVPSLLVTKVMYDAGPAWDYVSRWERLELLQHRPPMPEAPVKATAATGFSRGWKRWTCVMLLCFYSITMIGEVLGAMRLQRTPWKDRGARIQHTEAVGPSWIIAYLSHGGSAGVYRRRWDKMLGALGVPSHLWLTPGSLRGGGYSSLMTGNGGGGSFSALCMALTPSSRFLKMQYSRTLSSGNKMPSPWQLQLRRMLKSTYWDLFTGITIIIDVAFTCLDIDLRAVGGVAPVWLEVGSGLCLCIYALELGAVFAVRRCAVLKEPWTLLDIIIVGSGVLQLTLKFVGVSLDSVAVLRPLRVVRIMRLFRLFRKFSMLKELRKLISMTASCFKTLCWSFLFCFIVMTSWAMLAVEMLQPVIPSLVEDHWQECGDFCSNSLNSVMNANLLIFKTVIAGDSWGEVAVPVIQEFPLAIVIFMGSHLTIVFGVLNLVVAVVVDTFAEQRTKDVTNMAIEMEENEEEDLRKLDKMFAEIDGDGDGELTLQELVDGARRVREFQNRLRVMDIDQADLEQLFGMLDHDGGGTIDPDEFKVTLSRWAFESKTATRFVRYTLQQLMDNHQSAAQKLSTMEERLQSAVSENPRGGPPPQCRKRRRARGRHGCRLLTSARYHYRESLALPAQRIPKMEAHPWPVAGDRFGPRCHQSVKPAHLGEVPAFCSNDSAAQPIWS